MIWRNPLAWIGLATLLVPIAVHLLVRMHAQPAPFPSLRFLQTSRLAAVRRRALSDWPLLALRLAILALAVAAVADPFWLSASRRAAWANRTTRAIVVDTTSSVDARAAADAIAREQASAFASTVIRSSSSQSAELRDGVKQAVTWLRAAPPAAREIVIVSDFQRGGAWNDSLLAALPSYIGTRMLRVGRPESRRTLDGRAMTMREASGEFGARTPQVTVEADQTQAQWKSAALAERSVANAEVDAPGGAGASAAAGARTRAEAGSRVDAKTSARAGAQAAADSATSAGGNAGPNAAGGATRFAIAETPDGLTVDALGLRIRTSDADRAAARAALDAVLSEGVPLARAAQHRVELTLGEAAHAAARDGARQLRPLAAPWMASALDVLVRDSLLQEAAAATAASDASARAAVRGSAEAAQPDALAAPATSSSSTRSAERNATDAQRVSSSPLTLLRDARGEPLVLAGATGVDRSNTASASDSASPNGSRAAAFAAATRADAGAGPASGAGALSGNATSGGDTAALALMSIAPASSDITPLLLRATLRAIADPDPLPEAEVATLSDAQLDAWRRPAALPPIEELTRVETGDRRWFWGAALVLLGVETWLRRRMRRQEPGAQPAEEVAHAA